MHGPIPPTWVVHRATQPVTFATNDAGDASRPLTPRPFQAHDAVTLPHQATAMYQDEMILFPLGRFRRSRLGLRSNRALASAGWSKKTARCVALERTWGFRDSTYTTCTRTNLNLRDAIIFIRSCFQRDQVRSKC